MARMKSFYSLPLSMAVAAGIASASCSSSTTVQANAYVTSTLGASTVPGATGTCNINEPDAPFFNLGTPSSPVSNAGSSMGTAISVACSVHPDGDMFDVDLEVGQGEQYGITISATLTNTTTAQSNVTVSFNELNTGNYNEQDCTMSLSTEGNPAITAGRVWGTITCPNLVDMSSSNDSCYGTATLIFQNCDD